MHNSSGQLKAAGAVFYFENSGKLFTAEIIRSHTLPRENRFIRAIPLSFSHFYAILSSCVKNLN